MSYCKIVLIIARLNESFLILCVFRNLFLPNELIFEIELDFAQALLKKLESITDDTFVGFLKSNLPVFTPTRDRHEEIASK